MHWTEFAAIAYLSAPLLLFFPIYVRASIGLPASALIAAVLYRLARRTEFSGFMRDRRDVLTIAIISAIWLFIAGAFGVLRQNGDWIKHYAVINYLATKPSLAARSPDEFLRYNLGWYVAPALAVKLCGGHLQTLLTGVWNLAGAIIFFSCLSNYLGARRAALVGTLTFIFFSGADIIGLAVTGLQPGPRFHLEWWSGWAEYGSNTTSMFWVPQHALPSWLGIILLMRQLDRPTILQYVAFFLSACLLWSPFAVMGLAPFGFGLLLKYGPRKLAMSWQAIASLVLLAIPTAIYLLAGSTSVPHSFIWHDGCFGRALCFTWPAYALFLIIEIGLSVAILSSQEKERTPFFWVAVATLLVCPLIHMGAFNDFTMRASIPSLAVLSIGIARTAITVRGYLRAAVFVLVATGISTPLGEMARPLFREKAGPVPSVPVTPTATFSKLSATWPSLHYQYFAPGRSAILKR